MNYIERFEKLGFGMFVHFGLYSTYGKGEWAYYFHCTGDKAKQKYFELANKFKVTKNWAKDLVKVAKNAGCKYITFTTRHHEGFSLYDTKGLSDYDVMHYPIHRDLVREFVDACNEAGIVPFFYHTLLDWHHPDYENNFPRYIDYLINSVEILCKNYGKVGGFWFDGKWNKPDADWQEDRLYATIRKYQPEAMIINNTGVDELGRVGNKEIDSVTFERGKPCYVDQSDKHRAGEMCQVLNNHWGYAREDINYKPIGVILGDLVNCRRYNCNFLLNLGPMGNGKVRPIDVDILSCIGQWIKKNKGFIYNVHSTEYEIENGVVLTDDKYYYAVIKDVPMERDAKPAFGIYIKNIKLPFEVKSAKWLDNGKRIKIAKDNSFMADGFEYGISYNMRVAVLEKK